MTRRHLNSKAVAISGRVTWFFGLFVAMLCIWSAIVAAAWETFGGAGPLAYLGLPIGLFLAVFLWKTFPRVFPDRWPR